MKMNIAYTCIHLPGVDSSYHIQTNMSVRRGMDPCHLLCSWERFVSTALKIQRGKSSLFKNWREPHYLTKLAQTLLHLVCALLLLPLLQCRVWHCSLDPVFGKITLCPSKTTNSLNRTPIESLVAEWPTLGHFLLHKLLPSLPEQKKKPLSNKKVNSTGCNTFGKAAMSDGWLSLEGTEYTSSNNYGESSYGLNWVCLPSCANRVFHGRKKWASRMR